MISVLKLLVVVPLLLFLCLICFARFVTYPSQFDHLRHMVRHIQERYGGKFRNCNMTRVAEFRRLHPKEAQAQPVISEAQFQSLGDFQDILVSHGITPFLCGGTLLGWYRQCDLIPSTTDLDLCMPAHQYNPLLENSLRRDRRMLLYWILGRANDSLELSVYSRNVKLDLFLVYPEGNRSYVSGMYVGKRKQIKWYYPADMTDLCKAMLRNTSVLVPCNTLGVIESDYGTDWFTPHQNSKYYWYESGKNIEQGRIWTEQEWPNVYRKFTSW